MEFPDRLYGRQDPTVDLSVDLAGTRSVTVALVENRMREMARLSTRRLGAQLCERLPSVTGCCEVQDGIPAGY